MTSEITDKSLLRCTVKKSVHVTKRLVVCASYAIVAATSIVIIGFGVSNILPPLIIALWSALALLATALWSVLTSLATPLWSLLITIPWYYYAGAALISAIPVYSFLWCVARDLTEEDWKSESANKSAVAIATLAFSAIAFAFVIALALAFSAIAIAATTFAFATVALAIAITMTIATISINAVAVDNVSEITVWYYIFRFPGAAWHHYIRGDHP